MNPRFLANLCRDLQRAGSITLLEIRIIAELLHRGESTLLSLANSFTLPLESIANAAASLEGRRVLNARTVKEDIGFSLIRLTPEADARFREILANSIPPLRSKKLLLS